MLGISEKDWNTLTEASSVPVTFIQQTDQISLSQEDLQENTADTVSFGNASYYLYSRKISDTDIKLAVLIPDTLKTQMMHSLSKKSDLARIQDLVDTLQNKAQSYEEKLSEQKELLANNVFARLLNHSLEWNEHICEVLEETDFPVDAGEYLIFLNS